MTKPVYTFNADFQRKIAALVVRDVKFNLRTDGLIDPGYFQDETYAMLVALVLEHWGKYKSVPSTPILVKLVGDAIAAKRIRGDMVASVKDAIKSLLKENISDRDYVVDEVASFARHQAIIQAMEFSVDKLDKRDFAAIEQRMQAAFMVGAHDDSPGHDLVADLAARTTLRLDIAAGKIIRGITTGFAVLDDELPAAGFGRGELSVLLGPAKRGKSFGLMNFAINAALAGHNVLFVSLENSVDITMDRVDAYLSQTPTREILKNISAVETEVLRRTASAGVFKMHEFATGTFSPNDLRRLIEKYRAQGILFDEIVVDYWDIMRPNVTYRDDSIRESASIGKDLRAIAKEENAAMVTAVQSNREGFKAHTATADTVAEDFNKVRLADVFFSINSDDDERAASEARIYLAAMRNSETGKTIPIKQNLANATFIAGVMGRGGI